MALALVLGLHLDVAYSQHLSGGGGVFRAGVVEVGNPPRRPDGDAVEAGRTVDSAENLPAINNATREGLKATAGTVQRGLKNRINYFDYYLRIHDERIKVSPNHDSLRPTSTAESEDSAPEKTRKELLKERKKLKKKKAKLEKKRKKLQADLDRTTTELEELEKQPVPDTEIGRIIHDGKLVNLRRKKGNLEKDLKKIDADIEKIDKRLKAIEGELKNPDLTSTYSERRPDPSPSLVRYFQFMGDLHVDYRVALGMAEGREQTIDLAEWMAASYLDTSAGHPFAMIMGPSILASGVSEITVTVPSGEIASGKDVAVEAAPANMLPDNWEFFITGSFGRYDQDRLTGALDGFQSDTWTTTLGLEYRI
ncbi:MAG: hypothetical protein GXP30_04845, partial [Verrucomicrobia bacterium]|nr:hypothetical protein [Verrucomicrobiota bacterium]